MANDKRTQCNLLLAHFESGGSLTAMEAAKLYSVGRLAARVSDLRRSGYPIKGDMVSVKNQFGDTCRVKRYYMGSGSGG